MTGLNPKLRLLAPPYTRQVERQDLAGKTLQPGVEIACGRDDDLDALPEQAHIPLAARRERHGDAFAMQVQGVGDGENAMDFARADPIHQSFPLSATSDSEQAVKPIERGRSDSLSRPSGANRRDAAPVRALAPMSPATAGKRPADWVPGQAEGSRRHR